MEAQKVSTRLAHTTSSLSSPPTARQPKVDLTKQWERLDQQEHRVLTRMTLEAVDAYTRTVKEMLRGALDEQQTEIGGYFSPSGGFRYMVRIKSVSTELENLRQAILHHSPASVVMQRMDLIRGLLCDILL